MTGLSLGAADLADFAAATGDSNPLHLDPEFARISTFGQPVAHGALAAAATLALAGAELTGLARLAIDFDHPVLPGLRYRVQAGGESATLLLGDTRVLTIRWAAGRPAPEPDPGCAPASDREPAGCPPNGPPRVLSGGQLARLRAEAGVYRPDLSRLHGLLRRLTGTSIPGWLAEPLAWASFFAGMRTPGRDALLAGIRLTVVAGHEDGVAPGTFGVRAPQFDARTGLVTLDARLHGQSTVDLTVSAFLRHRLDLPDLDEIAGPLARSDRLAGRTVLVIGASRGLGAALACSVAGQAARVLAVSSRPPPPELVRRARAGRLAIDWVCCDAGDGDRLGAVLSDRQLDGLVLAAGPRVVGLPLAPEAVPAGVAHVDEAIRLALMPLAAVARGLRDGAFVLFVSSAALAQSQRLWPHYVAGKAAVEGLAAHTAQHHPRWRVAVARPPRLLTEMANGPASVLGAMPPGAAAAGIVVQLLSAAATPGEVQLIDAATIARPATDR